MTTRIFYLDFIKSISIFLVILLHSAAPLLYQIGKIDDNLWMIGNIYDSIARASIPLFFIVSGALLLRKEDEHLIILWKKIFFRFIIPLLLWSFVYMIYKIIVLNENINLIENLLLSVIRREYYHLWFLYTFIGIYIMLPVLRLIVHNLPKKYILVILFIWFLNVSIFPLLKDVYNLETPLYAPFLSGYLGYVLIGYFLNKILISKRIFLVSLLLILVGISITIMGTSIISHEQHKLNSLFYSYFSFSTILSALGMFIVLKKAGETIEHHKQLNTLFYNISIASFGIYLIHPIVLDAVKIQPDYFSIYSSAFIIPGIAITTLFLSFYSVKLIQHTPFIKKLLP